jgi:hypothetical protein
MVHESSPYEIWYHDVVTQLSISDNYSHVTEIYLDEGNATEAKITLIKQRKHIEKCLEMMREEYYERMRLENAAKDNAGKENDSGNRTLVDTGKDSKRDIAGIIIAS